MAREKRLTDQLAEALARPILGGEWAEGHKLPADAQICAEHGVSRTVVREAMRILSSKGLITARPRIGTLVAPRRDWAVWDPDILIWLESTPALADWLADALDIRRALEPDFAALAAARADIADNQMLQDALRALQTHADTAHEIDFLAALYAASGNDFARFSGHLAAWTVTHRATPTPFSAYTQLTAAIAQKDSATARQCAFQALLPA